MALEPSLVGLLVVLGGAAFYLFYMVSRRRERRAPTAEAPHRRETYTGPERRSGRPSG